jgi:hypothetical protein
MNAQVIKPHTVAQVIIRWSSASAFTEVLALAGRAIALRSAANSWDGGRNADLRSVDSKRSPGKC